MAGAARWTTFGRTVGAIETIVTLTKTIALTDTIIVTIIQTWTIATSLTSPTRLADTGTLHTSTGTTTWEWLGERGCQWWQT